jgi:glycosyltransferase involved in cell wall biosynthesis
MTNRGLSAGGRRLCILFHESERLGAGVSVLRTLSELGSYGWTASGWFPGPGPLVDACAEDLETHGYEQKPIAFSTRGWRRDPGVVQRARRTPAYLRSFKTWLVQTAPQIVHANSLLMLPEATVARRLGFPVVMQVHELPPPGRKRNLSLRWAAAIAEILIGVSRPVAAMLHESAGRTPVLTIHNGVPVSDRRRRHQAGFIVGTVGHVSRTKGTDTFLEAAARALRVRPTLRFEHVGPTWLWGDEEFDKRVEMTANSPHLRNTVRMLGYRPAEAALAQWGMFVLSSRQEAFPLSTLEAMAAGVAVVATNVGGVPEQIVHLESGILVPPEDPAEIAAWIVRLHDDPALRERLACGGRRRVRSSFTLEAQVEALDRAYHEALRRHASRHEGPVRTGDPRC